MAARTILNLLKFFRAYPSLKPHILFYSDELIVQCFPQSVLAHRYRDASISSETLKNPLIPNFF